MAPRRKQLVLALVVTVLCGLFLWLISLPGTKPKGDEIDLSFIGYTNRYGVKLARFRVTNRNRCVVPYGYATEPKTTNGWSMYAGTGNLPWAYANAKPCQDFSIEAQVPATARAW